MLLRQRPVLKRHKVSCHIRYCLYLVVGLPLWEVKDTSIFSWVVRGRAGLLALSRCRLFTGGSSEAQPSPASPAMGEATELEPYGHPAALERTLAICSGTSGGKIRTLTPAWRAHFPGCGRQLLQSRAGLPLPCPSSATTLSFCYTVAPLASCQENLGLLALLRSLFYTLFATPDVPASLL